MSVSVGNETFVMQTTPTNREQSGTIEELLLGYDMVNHMLDRNRNSQSGTRTLPPLLLRVQPLCSWVLDYRIGDRCPVA